ncbi:hypothetical protein D046_6196B, partial [Vibrio parahaemolyticus V-223/04]
DLKIRRIQRDLSLEVSYYLAHAFNLPKLRDSIEHRAQFEWLNGFGNKAETVRFDAFHHIVSTVSTDDHPFKMIPQTQTTLLQHF